MEAKRNPAQLLREDGITALYRGTLEDGFMSVLMAWAASPEVADECMELFERELSLADRLDSTWAATPLGLYVKEVGPVLLLADPGGVPLSNLLAKPLEIGRCLTVALSVTAALRECHGQDLVHQDLRPDNILVDRAGSAKLTGFGRAGPPSDTSHRNIQTKSLPYLAPEQTGRVKRPVDPRSDLYALGIIIYEMLTGDLPFIAADPAEWIHSHVARQPIPPSQRVEGVPKALEAIVLKLLSKKGDERYQTAAALEVDLSRCLTSLRSDGRVEDFEVAAGDIATNLRPLGRLYGRSQQIDTIISAFDNVRKNGGKEVILVTGQAGVGKSSLVQTIRKVVEGGEGTFVSGKFDQYAHEIPHSTIAQAFRGLVRHILNLQDGDLEGWRKSILEALGPSAQLFVNLVPELALVIGDQPPAPELPPQEARARFHVIFSRFLGVFAQPGRPLVLFIDDVQWLDPATIELIEQITLNPEVSNLLLICAYRDDEVPPGHPFDGARQSIRRAIPAMQEMTLEPLAREDLENLLGDMLHCGPDYVRPLADLLHRKTEGNPFFALQFLSSVAAEGLVAFDAAESRWRWDSEGIDAKRITDNAAVLVASELQKLPRLTLELVKTLSCLGHGASFHTLAIAVATHEGKIPAILWEAVESRFLVRTDDGVAFAHDRVQEAAYHLIPEMDRAEIHLCIGRALIAKLPGSQLRDRIFEVLDQVSKGIEKIETDVERAQIAELFAVAGSRAKTSAAYDSALRYFSTGVGLIRSEDWQSRYKLKFDLEVQQAECEFLVGEHEWAERHMLDLIGRAATRVDEAAVVRILAALYVAAGDQTKAVEVGLSFLRKTGLDWSAHPSEEDLRAEVDAMQELMAGRSVESLIDLQRMNDADWLAAMDVMASMILPALLTDGVLEELIYVRMVNLSLRHGNCDASCYAYASFIVLLGLRFGEYDTGRRFGDLALALVDRGFTRFKPRVYTCYSCYVVPWAKPFSASLPLIRTAIAEGTASGDLVFAATAAKTLVSNLLVSGAPLDVVEREAAEFLAASQKVGFGLAADSAIGQIILARDLKGRASGAIETEGSLPAKGAFLRHLQDGGPKIVIALAWYWIQQLQVRYLYEDHLSAVEAEREAGKLISVTRSFVDHAEYHFYGALAHAAVCIGADGKTRRNHLEALGRHKAKVDEWAKSCPATFEGRLALLEAEIARLEGRERDALRRFEDAISSSRENGFPQNEAISSERAANFCFANGFVAAGEGYLRNARDAYARWGANGKVRQLDARISVGVMDVQSPRQHRPHTLQDLDLVAVLEMSRAVSGEILLDRLVKRLMVTVTEHSGAIRGLLLLATEDGMRIAAEAVTDIATGVEVRLAEFREELPHSIVAHVARTREVVIIDDAQQSHLFADDSYVKGAGQMAMLCLPLEKQTKLVGVLYLENWLATHLFTPDQVAVLQLLASQATISLENASLYREAEETRERARLAAQELRLSYDMIPALAWNSSPGGTLLGFNKRWHDFTGLALEESLASGWTRAIHADDLPKVMNKWLEVLEAGEAGEIEARMIRFDGVSRSFLIRATPLRDERGRIIKWYGTNVDIDDLKRVEEAQEMLSRAGRLAALGELTASIAHEVNQPLMAIVMNAATCLRWLSADQLDIEEARQAAERIIRDGHRAGDVISSIRALAKKAPLAIEKMDVATMIDSVIVLTHSEVQRYGIVLERSLDENTGIALGDRSQLQQVLLNLILNAVEALAAQPYDSRRIRIRSKRMDDGRILIAVADSGPGVSITDPDRIFDAFFTTKTAGLGMGLSICRSIVEAHGGRLWVAPNEPSGSVFSFTLRSADSFQFP